MAKKKTTKKPMTWGRFGTKLNERLRDIHDNEKIDPMLVTKFKRLQRDFNALRKKYEKKGGKK